MTLLFWAEHLLIFLGYPKKLYDDCKVRGVINMCEEYHGPFTKPIKELDDIQ